MFSKQDPFLVNIRLTFAIPTLFYFCRVIRVSLLFWKKTCTLPNFLSKLSAETRFLQHASRKSSFRSLLWQLSFKTTRCINFIRRITSYWSWSVLQRPFTATCRGKRWSLNSLLPCRLKRPVWNIPFVHATITKTNWILRTSQSSRPDKLGDKLTLPENTFGMVDQASTETSSNSPTKFLGRQTKRGRKLGDCE